MLSKIVISMGATFGILSQVVASMPQGQTYLCVGDKSQGLYYSEQSKSWLPSDFEPHKFVVEPFSDERIPAKYSVKLMGSGRIGFCYEHKKWEPGTLFCPGQPPIAHFIFQPSELKFTYMYGAGYYDDSKDSPFVEIGTCTELD